MKNTIVLLGFCALLAAPAALAQNADEIQVLRAQIEALTARLDELERRGAAPSQGASAPAPAAPEDAGALPSPLEARIDQAVTEQMEEHLAGLSWAERVRWRGDFRYRFENIDEEGLEERNRSRIRARTSLEAMVSPTVKVGFGLATGGDDPVSANVTLGGGGSRKEIALDLAYFDWSAFPGTRVVGGKFSNFLVRPDGRGLLWDSDWRPEGLGLIWERGPFFAQTLGTWLEGDSRNGSEFAWVAQAGMNVELGSGELMFGGGYSEFDIAGKTPLFGEPEDFYGNSFVTDPMTGDLVFANNYRQLEAFAEYGFEMGGRPLTLFADYVVNTDADDDDTGYLFGARYGSSKARGTWDLAWFYQRLEADATVGLLTDSNFGGGGTDAEGHVLQGTYAFYDNWNFRLTYMLNETDLASGNPRDYDRVMLDLAFKY